jgi:hypothetical protein
VLAWAAVVTAGFASLLRYKAAPGETHQPPLRWPRESRLRGPLEGRPALVLFAHPHCPCTRASVSELARLVARVEQPVSVELVVVRPSGFEAEWDDAELRLRAATIPGATVTRDDSGKETERFRAAVSGFTVLYDGSGRLRFAGGLTASRGHEGESFGSRRVRAVLEGRAPDREDAPVFGCTLGVLPAQELD